MDDKSWFVVGIVGFGGCVTFGICLGDDVARAVICLEDDGVAQSAIKRNYRREMYFCALAKGVRGIGSFIAKGIGFCGEVVPIVVFVKGCSKGAAFPFFFFFADAIA